MAKKAHFFSHDLNARHDPKMTAMRGIYGAQGYGWFWLLIEMMAEANEYKLDMQSKYSFNAYAVQLQCKKDEVESFISDCINEFELFDSDGVSFWSKTLQRRMQYRDKVSETRTNAANAKWEKQRNDANAMHMHSKSKADVMQSDANETKQNEPINKTLKNIVDSDECDETFNRFWNAYPKKNGKAKAVVKWRTYFKTGLIDINKIMIGLERYMSYVEYERNVRKFDRQYLDGLTFVNGERWNDDWTQNNVKPFKQAEKKEREVEPYFRQASGNDGN